VPGKRGDDGRLEREDRSHEAAEVGEKARHVPSGERSRRRKIPSRREERLGRREHERGRVRRGGDRAGEVGDEIRAERVRARPVESNEGDAALAGVDADEAQAVLRAKRRGPKASSWTAGSSVSSG
jgi:hypothetical protein